MTSLQDTRARSAALAHLMGARLGVGGRDLRTKLHRAGRDVPRWVRRAADEVLTAEQLQTHPKLRHRVDPERLERAHRAAERWLRGPDPAELRKTRILRFLGVNAANLLIVAAAFIAYLVWAGHV